MLRRPAKRLASSLQTSPRTAAALTGFKPWTERIKRPRFIGQAEVGTVDPVWLGTEIDRQISAIKALQRFGYRPHAYKRSSSAASSSSATATGASPCATAFIVWQCCHWGPRSFPCNWLPIARRSSDADEVDTWVHVRSGYCSRDVALRMMRRYFGQD